MKEVEGYVPYAGYKTWYRSVGEEDQGKLPLLVLHGGPGAAHYYLQTLDGIARNYGRQVIYYDQMSCGNSKTPPLPDKWSERFFLDELATVRRELGLDRCHILGQSWGGMLAMMYAIGEPWHGNGHEGVESMVVASSPADMDLWEREARRLRSYLPREMQKALEQADEDGDYERKEVKEASAEYYRRHVSLIPENERPDGLHNPGPDPVGDECYHFMQGMSEFVVTGHLKGWSIVDQLGQIDIPTLVTSGGADECTPVIAKQVADGIPNARWELFEGGTHWVHGEQSERYNALVEEFLEENE
ncbi:MAG: proline iminopeptidase-family hydrolase [Coriobacteriales bacterium]|jgi:proline-specific peptidase